ncbi:MAG: N-acetyltransferase family protein [Flavobacteriales bacterium]
MKTRPAVLSDVPAIHGLIVELAVYEREPDAVINTISSLEADLFIQKRCFAEVSEFEGEIVGFALYFFGYSTWKGRTLYLEDLYVKETYRKHGIGQALFNTVVEIAKREGVRRMDWQVLEWNTPAIAFYKKNKALLDGEWINGRLFF